MARLLIPLVVFALVAILIAMPLLISTNRIQPHYFAQIRVGMTDAEVYELLGLPPGNYDGYTRNSLFPGGFGGGRDQRTWCSRHGSMLVFFDRDKRVSGRMVGDSVPTTWWARLAHGLLRWKQDEELLRQVARTH